MTTHTGERADEQSHRDPLETDPSAETNVSRWERAVSAVVGGALLKRGLERRSLGGVITAAAGVALIYRGVTGRSRLYRMLETGAPDRQQRQPDVTTDEPTVERSVTVGKPVEELEEFWRDPDQLTRIVGEFADVSETMGSEDHHHWRVTTPFGRPLEWQTRLVEEESGERLRWETIGEAPVPYEATIRFQPAPADRGTTVTLQIQYDPPGGTLGNTALEQLGVVPETLAGDVLRRFKSLAETGEIPSLETNPSARGTGDLV